MKIVIAGAGGLVGSEFARQLSDERQVLALKHDELDITNREMLTRLIARERPELVINCAVLGVDACELDPLSAWSVNVAGAENLARAVAGIGAEFLHLSSNYVFDGRLETGAYTINEIPAPINVYGETKLAGERAVTLACPRSFIVRTSWVFGKGKENFFSSVHRSLRAANPIRAFTDISASPTYVRDLVSRVIEILPSRRHATYHIVNSGLCSYYDFALEAARILQIADSAAAKLIEPVRSSEVRQTAPRPRYTPLRCLVSDEMELPPLRDWRAALAEYIRSN
jgi:dTDP-4-dehydrorhamnose reductase